MRGSVTKNVRYARRGIGSISQAIKLPLFATSASETQSAPRNSAPGYEIERGASSTATSATDDGYRSRSAAEATGF